MMRGRLLLVLWCSVILGAVSFRVDHHSCVSDYLKSISCSLNISDDLEIISNNYSLTFTDQRGISSSSSSCLLVARGHGYHGDCKVIKDNDMFSIRRRFLIELCYNSTCRLVENTFIPSQRIKLTPPPELELLQTSDTVNITCMSETYKSHHYLRNSLQFEVFLQDSVSRQIKRFQLYSPEPVTSIDKKSQQPNTNYCVNARFKPHSKGYSATWSEWSESVCWENKAEEEQEHILFILLKFLSPVCVLTGLLLMVFCSPVVRMSIKTLTHTPTPAPFFQPLFQKHEGNLQDWLSHQSQFALPYKTEKDLIADSVTVVPKPVMKDPEESQAFLMVSLPHLTFPQSPASYVGLPVMPEAPPPVTAICPGDTPYTQLPCSVWGFGISDVEVISSTPTDFLEMSHADSGCSCEDLTQSPECSLPSSPVGEGSPPRYCTDYCILNKTAEGVVPVLMSNESNRNVPPDPLKTER